MLENIIIQYLKRYEAIIDIGICCSHIRQCIGTKATVFAFGYPIALVAFTLLKVTDCLWGQRLKASRELTIPLAFSKCEETGRYENLMKAAYSSDEYKVGGFSFDDTDVYKMIEGANN